jgi:hypothetical protein
MNKQFDPNHGDPPERLELLADLIQANTQITAQPSGQRGPSDRPDIGPVDLGLLGLRLIVLVCHQVTCRFTSISGNAFPRRSEVKFPDVDKGYL